MSIITLFRRKDIAKTLAEREFQEGIRATPWLQEYSIDARQYPYQYYPKIPDRPIYKPPTTGEGYPYQYYPRR